MKGARQIQAALSLRAVTKQDDVESAGFGAACCERIARVFEPNRLVSKGCQFILVWHQPFAFALDDQHGLAVPKRK